MNTRNACVVVRTVGISYADVAGCGLKNMLKRSTDKIGPILQRATRPKLCSLEFLPFLLAARPAPSAIIKGTVIGPVVTPPESNAVGTNSFGANIVRIIIMLVIDRVHYYKLLMVVEIIVNFVSDGE